MVTSDKSLATVLEELRFQLNALDKQFITEEDFANAVGEIYDFYSNH